MLTILCCSKVKICVKNLSMVKKLNIMYAVWVRIFLSVGISTADYGTIELLPLIRSYRKGMWEFESGYEILESPYTEFDCAKYKYSS